MSELLSLEGVTAGYGRSVVLEDIDLVLGDADSAALLGRNGAGKTTLLATLMGFTRVHRGALRWRGRDVGSIPTFRRVRLGIGWVPQERLVWRSLTVDEHLTAVAMPGHWTPGRVYRLFPSLAERRRNRGDQLSGGEQQMLAIARALVVNPHLLLLDEPTEGLAPMVVRELVNVIGALLDAGEMAIVIVEQHARLALSLTRDALVLDRGRIVHHGPSSALLDDPEALDRLLAVA